MSSIVVSGDVSGAITIAAPSAAGTNTLTLPTLTQTVNVMGPAFSAYQSVAQSISNNLGTKIQFQTKEFDTANCFDNTTNYRFTPNVAGYYQVSGAFSFGYSVSTLNNILMFYKNGSEFKRVTQTNSSTYGINGSFLMYFNGTTDYIEAYVYQNSGGSLNLSASSNLTYFQACFLRGA